MNKKITISSLALLLFNIAFSQQLFSIATDVGIQRNFKKEQKYWAIGHTTQVQFNITPKDGVYVTFAYYYPSYFKNSLIATAKDISTTPQQISYTNKSKMRPKQLSIGYKKYLRGTADAETNWNIYAFGGFGVLMGRVDNTYSVAIDTSLYNVPVRAGKANFKRLTFDLGAGWEIPVGADFFFYTEAKVWIPTTDYPSKYIFVNANAPFTAMLGIGLRLLF